MSGTIFFVCWISWISRCFSCSHFSNSLSDPIGKQSAMSRRGKGANSNEGSPIANQNQRFERRRDPSIWFYAARGARGKILRRIWDIRSILGMSIKDKVVMLVQGTFSSEATGKCSKFRLFVRAATPRTEYEVHEPSIHDEGLPLPTEEVGN